MAGTASTRAIWDAQARPRPVLRPCELRAKLGAQREVIMTGLDLCVPKTSSKSCDQAIFVDHDAGASLFSDAVLGEIDRLGGLDAGRAAATQLVAWSGGT